MKFGLVGPTFPFRGGIAAHTTLLEHAMRKRHDVVFVSFKRQYPTWIYPGPSDRDESEGGIRPLQASALLDSMNPWTWYQTAKRLVSERVDVVILPWWVSFWSPQFLTILSLVRHRSNAKILFVCHNVEAHESKFFDKVLTRMVLKKGDFFIVHSKADEDNLRTLLPGSVIRRQFHPTYDAFNSAMTSETCRKAIDVTHPVILFFGFVREYKGLKYLIAAMPEILAKIPATLLIVGEFWKDKAVYLKMIDDLGIGALFGLYNWKYEALALLRHTNHFEAVYNVGPHTISFPRLQPASGFELDERYIVSDEDFTKLVAIIRLAVPYTGLILTARESAEIRDEVLQYGVSQIDGGTNIELKGYTDDKEEQNLDHEQFEISDNRTLNEVIEELVNTGYIPSFCTACYRLGRTGEHFMEFSVPGFIKRYCQPNAMLTLAEYLEDYAPPTTKAKGYKLIDDELAVFKDEELKKSVEARLAKIKSGKRDIYY